MKSRYDAVVIGTGFGGAVAACRLAQAGFDVGILERGRRYRKGSFPRDWNNLLNGWLWKHQQGLFDLKPVSEMQFVQAAGYGGGSLIYANVHLRPPADIFEQGWPQGYSRTALDPYYDLVAYMLDVRPITASLLGLPAKTVRQQEAARELHRLDQFFYPNLAVNFGQPETSHRNRFGIDQEGCRHCGECNIGCNHHAKNTLDLNYLAVAEQSGRADPHVLCEVTQIEPNAGCYRVAYRDHSNGGATRTLEATYVFLCAGAVNSSELLLRCRDQLRTLPKLSNALGRRYSGNGDFLAFAFDTAHPWKPWDGPSITTGILVDQGKDDERAWFLLEEGGHPIEVAGYLQLLHPRNDWLRGFDALLKGELEQLLQQKLAALSGGSAEAGASAAVFLGMGRDRADGRLRLLPATYDLCVEWNVQGNLPLYNVQDRIFSDVAQALGGKPALNPFWRLLHLPVTVHSLGGCTMADAPANGVTDANGEAHGYPGLFILDGASLPESTGTNPSSTIAAVAERNIEHFIRKAKGDPSWRAPEFRPAQEAAQSQTPLQRDPLGQVRVPAGGTIPPRTPAVGIRFTETMRGYVQPGFQPADNYTAAEKAARLTGNGVEFTLTILIENLDRFIADKAHTAVANGRITAAGFTGTEGAPVSNGVFNLFVETGQARERRMLYLLPFHGSDGQPYLLDGFKEVRGQSVLEVWPATTTLYTVIRRGHHRGGPILATGIIRLHKPDFLRQLTTFEATGTDDPVRKAEALARFGELFMGTLWEVFTARGPLAWLHRTWASVRLFFRGLFGKG